jgi:hypothetical protein
LKLIKMKSNRGKSVGGVGSSLPPTNKGSSGN